MKTAIVPYTGLATGIGFRKVKGQGWHFGIFTLCGFHSSSYVVPSDDDMAAVLRNRRRIENQPKIAAARKQAADWREIFAGRK